MVVRDLQSYVELLRSNNDLHIVDAEVDPYLELAEIHRRVIKAQGPALLFTNVLGSSFPVATNLFGTKNRIDMAFGPRARDFIERAAQLPHELLPPSLKKVWGKRDFFLDALKVGVRKVSNGSVLETQQYPRNLNNLPVITSWSDDGGPFFTLPLVYTEDPELGISNLGMYRMQRFNESSTGMHMQIGKGGGFHLYKAKQRGENLPLNVFLGGPPAAVLAAVAPLPENVPEILIASRL